jgi:hypothetical protein
MWTKFVHHTRAPLECRHPDHSKCAVVLEAVKDEPSDTDRPTNCSSFCRTFDNYVQIRRQAIMFCVNQSEACT